IYTGFTLFPYTTLFRSTLEQLQQFSDLITADVFDKALTLEASVNARDHIGGTSPKQVEAAIARAHKRLEQLYA
ncbi:MAG TPA: hypothetical protein DCE34_05725, partial [Acinetobacter nosocomialis]|nr:hypothetical protein [Acinetobacter nosocomialis]